MGKSGNILAIDQGTTSSRAIVFGAGFERPGPGAARVRPAFPGRWLGGARSRRTSGAPPSRRRARRWRRRRLAAGDIAGIGITNQRETCVLWDRRTGKPIHRAIVWQDRRTADMCRRSRRPATRRRSRPRPACCSIPTSRPPRSPGCSTTWRARARSAQAGHLAFGTIDTFLLWRLTGGTVHATDATNASRTLLYDIHKGAFDDDLLRLFGVPRAILPEVRDCDAAFRRDRAVDPGRGRADPAASPATSRPPPSARPASRRAWSRQPTARAALRCSTPAASRSPPATAC